MPKDEQKTQRNKEPQQLPMPKYDYQRPQSGSVSAPYRDQAREAQGHLLHNVHFG